MTSHDKPELEKAQPDGAQNQPPSSSEREELADYLAAVLHRLPQGVTVYDKDLNLIFANDSFYELMGLTPTQKQHLKSLADVISFNIKRGEYGPLEDANAFLQKRLTQARELISHRVERRRPNGRLLEITGRPLARNELDEAQTSSAIGPKKSGAEKSGAEKSGAEKTEDEKAKTLGGFLSTYTDITDYRRTEETVRRVSDLMSDAIRHSSTYIWEVNEKGTITFMQGAEDVLGYESDDLLGHPASEIEADPMTLGLGIQAIGSESEPALLAARAQQQPYRNLITRRRRADGGIIWVSSSGRPTVDNEGVFRGYRGVDVDVTELTEARMELERLALFDNLTGLANRHKFHDRYRIESQRQARLGTPMSLIVMDIDHFKQVNDNHGHMVGDEVLQAIAHDVQQRIRGVDLAARFGGEEFIILLPDTDTKGAAIAAESLRAGIESLNVVSKIAPGLKVSVTASFGVSTTPYGTSLPLDILTDLADKAVYEAKKAGRNCVRLAESLA